MCSVVCMVMALYAYVCLGDHHYTPENIGAEMLAKGQEKKSEEMSLCWIDAINKNRLSKKLKSKSNLLYV